MNQLSHNIIIFIILLLSIVYLLLFIFIIYVSLSMQRFLGIWWPFYLSLLGCPRGVMVKAMHCGIVVREFVLQSRYYVHFWANTLGKGMNPLILPPAMGK